MSSSQETNKGSLPLKLLIAFLVMVLGYSVFFPKQQWEQQGKDLALSRQRLDNLGQAGQLYVFFNRSFPGTMDELIAALDTTFVEEAPAFQFAIESKADANRLYTVKKLVDLGWAAGSRLQEIPPMYSDDGLYLGHPLLEDKTFEEIEVIEAARLVELDSLQSLLRDSLLITLEDTMRIKNFSVLDLGLHSFMLADSSFVDRYHTQVFAKMKPLYEGLGSDTLHLISEKEIVTTRRRAGVTSREYWAATAGVFESIPGSVENARFTKGAEVRQALKNFSFTLPLETITLCPSTGLPYEMRHVNKYKYKGDYIFQVDGEEGDSISTIAQTHAFLNELKAEAADAIGARFAILTKAGIDAGNPTFQVSREEKATVVVEETMAVARELRSGRRFIAEGESFQIARSDSMVFYTDDEKRESELFAAYQGPMADQFELLLGDTLISDIVGKLRFTREFEPVQVDTVGLAFYSPITGDEVYTSGINRIFEVSPPENHGSVYNGTKSWE
jgi:hypothetical protein